eukprot:CAMPEP_0172187140 /NCGR_PEP_ID=MMETSP1050-20130122/21177_1 /TAXON_ID=233186 /ORGANISM="Cryptomonas curvata, Strain CCAP979/52" /LENGTH=286 /DNA_ID=CAMNT_0012861439 /DNA_START=203 /DNA_END=1059 /DNA_ORIENTATION=-
MSSKAQNGVQVQACLLQVFENLYLAKTSPSADLSDSEVHCFAVNDLKYSAFCDDFGPMSAASVLHFNDLVEKKLAMFPTRKVICCPESDVRNMTNAVFLLGSFLIMKLKKSPADTWQQFSALGADAIESYRDATFAAPSFRLSLLDCWQGLARGIALGWMDKIDLDEYEHYDDPLNGDLHIIVPDRFVAFKGPKHFPGAQDYCDNGGFRDFRPSYYIDIFKELGVTDVVRLNEPEYDGEAFLAAGIEHHDLEFPDCTPPSDAVAGRFLRIVDGAKGLVAVHCKAGL